MKSSFFSATVFLLGHLLLIGSAVAEEPIRVGVLACLSGGCAEWGSATRNGLLLAQEEVNSQGGALGRRLELTFEDTDEATSGMKAVTAFRRLISSEGIKLFIGPNWTPAGLALAPVAGKMSDVILISPSLGVAEFNESAPNLFNTMMHSETATRALARRAVASNWKRIGIFSSEQPWESLQARTFRDEFVRLGGEIASFQEANPNIKDLRTESLKIATAKPDAVFLTNLNQEAIAARQLQALGYKGPFLAALLDKTRIDEAAGALEGAISAQSPEASADFVAKYTARFGMRPSGSADTAHDALIALTTAIISARSTDALPVQNALLHVDFQGASGRVRFDEKGGIVREPSLVQVSKNSLIPLEENH